MKWIALVLGTIFVANAAVPKLPMGMNVQGLSYWSASPYLDPMKGSGTWMTYSPDQEAWETGLIDSIPMRPDDYPVSIPRAVKEVKQCVRTMLNNCREGRYVARWDGKGTLQWEGGARAAVENARTVVTFTGDCGHAWLQVASSDSVNPIRNIRLVPLEWETSDTVPLFDPDFVRGLRPFHALRFMDWMSTNGSTQSRWSDRAKPTDRTWGVDKGMPIEHAIALSNAMGSDAWFCVPHRADDDYIRNFARLVRDSLRPELKAYVEYSNEIWNWGFAQAQFVGQNGREFWEGETSFVSADSIVRKLGAVGLKYCQDADEFCHPEKDACMMDRTFRIWKGVFGSADTSRLVRVATAQHAWIDNTRRILEFLFKDGAGADAISVGGYFNFEESSHLSWNAMDPKSVTAKMVLAGAGGAFDTTTAAWTRASARYARQFKLPYLVYEGGQHMQPFTQGEWGYNQAVWDAQIDSGMYSLYMRNFGLHVEDTVDCKLFMAFSYVSDRESRWGSWGHLESYAQSALQGAALKAAAPKYAALLDANAPRRAGASVGPKQVSSGRYRLRAFDPLGRALFTYEGVPADARAALHRKLQGLVVVREEGLDGGVSTTRLVYLPKR